MATSERQIAANKLNARKSTGPKSRTGKHRARLNAVQHGLAAMIELPTEEIEKRARELAGEGASELACEFAREAAHSEFELARINRAKVGLIDLVYSIGALERSPVVSSVRDAIRMIKALERGKAWKPEITDPSETMPSSEPERLAEAIRRALPVLNKFERYESRAVLRRDRALRSLVSFRGTA